jgi:hypothetical protein
MRQYDSDEELDQYVIDHAKYFTVVQIRPGGFVNGHGSNYIREEVPTLEEAMERAKVLYDEKKKSILIYAVADFAGAIGFNRPVRQYPEPTYRSKSQKMRDEKLEAAKRATIKKAERDLARQTKAPKKDKFKAAVFKTEFSTAKKPAKVAQNSMTHEEFMSSSQPMVKLVRV